MGPSEVDVSRCASITLRLWSSAQTRGLRKLTIFQYRGLHPLLYSSNKGSMHVEVGEWAFGCSVGGGVGLFRSAKCMPGNQSRVTRFPVLWPSKWLHQEQNSSTCNTASPLHGYTDCLDDCAQYAHLTPSRSSTAAMIMVGFLWCKGHKIRVKIQKFTE